MSLADQDVAAALYREQPVVLYYLDHDPVLAAQYACDAHVRSGLLSAVTMLSTAWHEPFNSAYLPIEERAPYAKLFQRRVPPPRYGADPQPVVNAPDPYFTEYQGNRPYWLLMGQRIGDTMFAPHLNCEWARAAGGNYRWVHAWGVALADEYELRFEARSSCLPLLWTLEAVPPNLIEDEEGTEPTPVVEADCQVIVDGYYDAPASYRTYYVNCKQALLQWTRRAAPPWLVKNSAGRYVLNTTQGL